MSRRTAALSGLGALVMAAAVAAPTSAQSTAKPVPCAGVAQADPAGDQQYHVPQVGVPSGQEAAPLTDFTGIFFRGDGTKVTANMTFSELSKTVPDEAAAVRWTFYYAVGETAYYLRAVLYSDGEIEYVYGEDAGATLEELGTTKGEFHEGKDGVISMVIPAAAGGKPGTAFDTANAISAYQFPSGLGSSADFMPDDGEFSGTFPACPANSTTPPPAIATDPGPPPSPSGSPQSTAAPQSDLRITVKPATLRAKKLKRGRAIAFKLSSNEPLTSLRATLKRGSRSVGSGKLARLQGSGTLKVKPKGRLRKGRYTLLITATRANGSQGVVPARIRVR